MPKQGVLPLGQEASPFGHGALPVGLGAVTLQNGAVLLVNGNGDIAIGVAVWLITTVTGAVPVIEMQVEWPTAADAQAARAATTTAVD